MESWLAENKENESKKDGQPIKILSLRSLLVSQILLVTQLIGIKDSLERAVL